MTILRTGYSQTLIFATKAHEGQIDKVGRPYIEHPIAVAKSLNNEVDKHVALLHDTVEDTDVTIQDIYNNFGPTVGDAVDAITQLKKETYREYLERVIENPIARRVKIKDIDHNSSPARIAALPIALQYRMVNKHLRARHYLLTGEWFESEHVDQLIKKGYKK